MKNFTKLYLLTFFLFSQMALFAQPGTNDGTGNFDTTDPEPAPVNTKIFLLIIIGLCFAFYKLKNKVEKI